jgi:hypothetical protein
VVAVRALGARLAGAPVLLVLPPAAGLVLTAGLPPEPAPRLLGKPPSPELLPPPRFGVLPRDTAVVVVRMPLAAVAAADALPGAGVLAVVPRDDATTLPLTTPPRRPLPAAVEEELPPAVLDERVDDTRGTVGEECAAVEVAVAVVAPLASRMQER